MGCCLSRSSGPQNTSRAAGRDRGGRDPFKPPRWKSTDPLTESQLARKREEFWDTAPHYGGDRVIWDALKAACEADQGTAKAIIDSAGIIVSKPDMTVCYDERGSKYELPKYVLSAPTNLQKDPPGTMLNPPSELEMQSTMQQ